MTVPRRDPEVHALDWFNIRGIGTVALIAVDGAPVLKLGDDVVIDGQRFRLTGIDGPRLGRKRMGLFVKPLALLATMVVMLGCGARPQAASCLAARGDADGEGGCVDERVALGPSVNPDAEDDEPEDAGPPPPPASRGCDAMKDELLCEQRWANHHLARIADALETLATPGQKSRR